jgi:hypothetical protein
MLVMAVVKIIDSGNHLMFENMLDFVVRVDDRVKMMKEIMRPLMATEKLELALILKPVHQVKVRQLDQNEKQQAEDSAT